MNFIRCVGYLALLGIVGFIIGRLIPKKWFCEDVFPYKQYHFEKNGKFYDHFQIKKWKDKLLDMSKIFPKIMPIKRLVYPNSYGVDFMTKLPVLIKETCIAEFIHSMLSLAGFVCMAIWDGLGGFIVSLLYALGNIPFIMAQRYNRPRFIYLLNRQAKRTKNKLADRTEIAPPVISPDFPCNTGVCLNAFAKGENTAKSNVLYHNHE